MDGYHSILKYNKASLVWYMTHYGYEKEPYASKIDDMVAIHGGIGLYDV